MKKVIILIVLLIPFSSYHMTEAQIIHVPADQPTIQAGIELAADGDTVLVADGTYLENINFMGKAILLTSHFTLDGDTSHINNTVIDGSQPENPDYGSTVILNSGEDTTSVLCGFTITGGTGLIVGEFDMMLGGGIACHSTGVKIVHNKIINNQINYPGYAGGGGIGCVSEDEENWLVVRNNDIHGNTCDASVIEAFGGGVFSGCNLVLENNEVYGNTCTAMNNAEAKGGGVLQGSQSRTLLFKIHNNFIHDNFCEGKTIVGAGVMLWYGEGSFTGNAIRDNAGIAVNTALGGGMHLLGATGFTEITGNDFAFNSLEGYHVQGGGIQIALADATVNILNNSFIQNMLYGSYQAHGGGLIIIQNQEVSIINNLFQENVLQGGSFTGAGISGSDPYARTEIRNNTFDSNSGPGNGYGGGISFFDANNIPLEVDGNIFENNSIMAGGGLYTYNCYNSLIFNNIFSGNVASQMGGGCRFRYYAGKPGESSSPEDGLIIRKYETNTISNRSIDHPLVINNTFINNTSPMGGAIYSDHQDEFPLIVNSIFRGNVAGTGSDIYHAGSQNLIVSYSDIDPEKIYGSWEGESNIDADPLFIDPENGNYCIDSCGSPCLAAGIDSIYLSDSWYHSPDHDIRNFPRPLPGNSPPDMGAYEVDQCVGMKEFRKQNSKLRMELYPNPSEGIVDCRFDIFNFQRVIMKIYDMHGKEVSVLLDKRLPEGKHVVRFDMGGLPDGIYFIRLQAEDRTATDKILKMR